MIERDEEEARRRPPEPPIPEHPHGLARDTAQVQLAAARRECEVLKEALAASRAREEAVAHELQHRVQNMLAVIRSIYRRSRESSGDPAEFADHFAGRLDAISRYQAMVDGEGSAGIEIEDIVRNELHEVRSGDGPNCTIEGPAVHLHQRAAMLIGLALHELATNSIKFGALAQNGRLAITWFLEERPEGSALDLHWTETNVSLVASAPRPSGFGRQLIEEAISYQLGATTSFSLRPGGVACRILLPLAKRKIEDGGGGGPEAVSEIQEQS